MEPHSLETKIALLELQLRQLNDALRKHMLDEQEVTKSILAQLDSLKRSAWVVSGVERLGWVALAAAMHYYFR